VLVQVRTHRQQTSGHATQSAVTCQF
jgi:hypothetical protein